MTIQISVLLWAVICFCLCIVILDRLLFKPVFAVMDKRRARIDAAAERKAEYETAAAEAEEAMAQYRETEAKKLLALAAEEISCAKLEAEKLEAEALRALEEKNAEYREKLKEQAVQIEKDMDTSIDRLAQAYISALVS